ncbi:MAG: hypothetical protein J6M30_00210 [Bacteroidales bacterium]|nr:hypothetical protein [Bacteroidales bacterium]
MDINKNIKNINSNITNTVKSYLPLQIQYLFGVFGLGLFFMLLYRVINFAVHSFMTFSDVNIILLLRSLLMGIVFDTVTMGWIFLPFALLMAAAAVFNINKRWFYRPLHLLLCAVCAFAFFITCADIAYSIYFGTHINIIAVSWLQSPSYLKALFLRHPIYLLYLSGYLFSMVWFVWLMYCLYNATLLKTIPPYRQVNRRLNTAVSCLITAVFFFAATYARIPGKQPLNVSDAYISNNEYFNQLSVNPLFNIAKSMQEESLSNIPPITVVNGSTAKKVVEEQMFMRNDKTSSQISLPAASNIVIVFMEDVLADSVSSKDMPFLNSLMRNSVSFSEFYPDGENVYNGIYSTLFAMPNVLSENSMNTTIVPRMQGMASVVKNHRYSRIFSARREQKYANISRFLAYNDFNVIQMQKDLKLQQQIKTLSEQPFAFLACVLINAGKDKGKPSQNTDREIKQFINQAKQQTWFNNTLFVFTGTNGKDRIPLIFYMPKVLKKAVVDNVASQTDVMPTVLTMLDADYQNENILGLNILSSQRTFAVSSYAHSLVVRDKDWKYVWRDSGQESLYYKGSDKQGVNYIKANIQQAEKMKTYGFSMLQMTQYKINQYKLLRR